MQRALKLCGVLYPANAGVFAQEIWASLRANKQTGKWIALLVSGGQQPSLSMIFKMVSSVWRMPSLARRPTFFTVRSTPLVTMPSPP